jgi:hypothetical protein
MLLLSINSCPISLRHCEGSLQAFKFNCMGPRFREHLCATLSPDLGCPKVLDKPELQISFYIYEKYQHPLALQNKFYFIL